MSWTMTLRSRARLNWAKAISAAIAKESGTVTQFHAFRINHRKVFTDKQTVLRLLEKAPQINQPKSLTRNQWQERRSRCGSSPRNHLLPHPGIGAPP